MPVLPLVESISVRPRSLPLSSASRTICSPARSLTLPPGLNHSSLAWISTPFGSSDRSRTSGVLPTALTRESKITNDFHRRPGALAGPPLGGDLDAQRKKNFFFFAAQDPPGAQGAELWFPGRIVHREVTHPARRQIARRPESGLAGAVDADRSGQQLLLIESLEEKMPRIPLLLLGAQHPPAMAGTMVNLSPSCSAVARPWPWRMSSSLRKRFT